MNLITSKSFIHPITEQYLDKIVLLGGDISDLNSVNKFVIELSKIIHPSLWVCWPLRSSQSVGTGTIAPSLGGLGDFPGTLVNGPTWGTDGITRNASNQYVDFLTSNQTLSNSPFCGCVTKAAGSTTYGNLRLWALGESTNTSNTANQVFYSTSGANISGRTSRGSSFSSASSTVFTGREFLTNFSALCFGSNYQFSQANGSTSLTTGLSARDTFTTTFVRLMISGAYGTNSAMDGIYSFFICINSQVSTVQGIAIYNLYKQTLGQGLGLP